MLPEGINEQDALEELARVVASAGFARNERMSRFLRFLVERHLQGRDDELKESLVGVEIFGRKPGYDPKQDSIVRTEAGRLRSRLAEYFATDGREDPILIDLPRGGYVPVLRRSTASIEAPAPVAAPRRSRMRGRALAAAALVIATASAGWWAIRAQRGPIPIAVLPLQSLSPDGSDPYFADGLTDEIIRNLSAVEGLAVRSHTSAFAFRETPRIARDVASRLDVDYLVEGSVLVVGPQLRVNARLVHAEDDVTVWSGHFNRQLTDVFAIQDEISRGIVNQLRLTLGRGRWRYETSVQAYDLYLRALSQSTARGFQGIQESIGTYERAIAADSSFAPAYAGLGAALAYRSAQFAVDHPADELERMRWFAAKAVELDPLLAAGHAAVASAYARDSQWDKAEKSFRRSLELDPNRSRTLVDFAMWHLQVVGREEEALVQLRAAERSDPLSSEVQLALAALLMSRQRFGEAEPHCYRMAEQDPMRVQCLGRIRLGQGKADEAARVFAGDPTLATNAQARGFLGYAHAQAGRRQTAEQLAAAAADANELALIYAGLRDKDRTLAALDRMSVVGAQRIGRYLTLPEMAFLAGDARVDLLRRRVGLAN